MSVENDIRRAEARGDTETLEILLKIQKIQEDARLKRKQSVHRGLAKRRQRDMFRAAQARRDQHIKDL